MLLQPQKPSLQPQKPTLQPQKPSPQSIKQYPHQPQKLPTSLEDESSRGRSELIKMFKQDQTEQLGLNEYIPQNRPTNEIRIATYNVHYWSRPESHNPMPAGEDTAKILLTIKNIEADIIVLQEVSFVYPEVKKMFESYISDIGFKYTTFCKAHDVFGAFFGNYIISKFPIINTKIIKLEKNTEGRCAIQANIKLANNKELTIVGTHLDVYDETEQVRVRQIKDILKHIEINNKNVILTGDFNSMRRKDYSDVEWNTIVQQEKVRGFNAVSLVTDLLETQGWQTSFTKINATPPKSTVWPSRTVDHIYVNSDFSFPILGSYVYHNSSSDHIPVIIDILI